MNLLLQALPLIRFDHGGTSTTWTLVTLGVGITFLALLGWSLMRNRDPLLEDDDAEND